MQGCVFFDEESDGAIYFDVTAEIEELLAIFRFWGSSQVLKNGQKRGAAPVFCGFWGKKVFPCGKYIYCDEKTCLTHIFGLVTEGEVIKTHFLWFGNSKKVSLGYGMKRWRHHDVIHIKIFKILQSFRINKKIFENRSKTGKTRPPKLKNCCFFRNFNFDPPIMTSSTVENQKFLQKIFCWSIFNLYSKFEMFKS